MLSSAGVAEYIETGSGSSDALSGLETEKCPQEDIRTFFAGVRCVLTSALRTPKLKSTVSVRHLLKLSGISR